ncbi:Esa1p-associated factor [Rachicladosporium monterosium]|uniref:Chromatin modification-related protein EAF3 n=1 Tax=Rachicladosporium monterosium TaxID=1507873 RepID=A0ABR0L9S5_9PEZI|nr:Esa1p-associated factor [Rachicladosporium monterosium]
MAPSTSAQPAYSKDEKVLCFHHELLYEAKVVEAKVKDPNDKKDGYLYRVHYKGWKNTLIPAPWICKAEAKDGLQMSPAESAPALAYSEERHSKEKRMGTELTPANAQEEDFLRRPAVRLFMPDALKSILVDDWEKVTKEQKLAPVPSPTPVTQFLNEYEASEMAHRRPNSAEADILEEVVAGVKEYFNKSLGRILLYRFERQQFYEMHKAVEAGHGEHAGKTLADLYGCEHLLRLFVSLPDLIAHTNMDQQSVSRLREELTKMTSWMAKRLEKYLGNEYQHAGQEYLESAKNGA